MAFLGALALGVGGGAATAHAGPVLLAGIDVEDGGVDAHGSTSTWADLFNRFKNRVTSGKTGLLVVGGGKDPTDDVTVFWNAIAQRTGQQVTHVNGSAIATAGFSDFGMIAIASSEPQTELGGLTQGENDLLARRRASIRRAVNAGSALLGFSQTGFSNPYRYLSRLGSFDVNLAVDYGDVDSTAAGRRLGITDTNLDIDAWHDEYVAFPSFLRVLARNADTGEAAMIGGRSVIIDDRRPRSRSRVPSCSATGRIRVRVRDNRGGAGPRRVLYRIDGGRLRSKRTNNRARARRGSAVIRIPNGRHRIVFRAVDRAGNREARANRASLRVDRVNRCARRLRPRFTG